MEFVHRMFSNKQILETFFQCRKFSSKKNHYDTLGITPHATLSDIKKAYYDLSMIYHPDKNDGSIDASDKFRAVTEAYEVLGNIKSKRLYDKGVLHTTSPIEPIRPRPRKPNKGFDSASNYQPIYNFEKWSRHHYGQNIIKRAKAKQMWQDLEDRKTESEDEDRVIIVFSLLFIFLAVTTIIIKVAENSLDKPPLKKDS